VDTRLKQRIKPLEKLRVNDLIFGKEKANFSGKRI